MGMWEKFGQPFQNRNHIPKIPNTPRNRVLGAPLGNNGGNGDIGDIHTNPKKEHGTRAQALHSARRGLPFQTAGPGTVKKGNSQTPAPPHGQRAQGAAGKAPVPGTLRWELLPCTLVPVALQLDASGALTWQAGQFDENVRALCEEHGARIRAFLQDMPGRRWESWQENALEAADRWETGQGARQKGAKA